VGHVGQAYGVAFTPDGKRFATSSFDGTVQVWETATLKPVFQIDADLSQRNTYRYAVAFDPTGRWLLAPRDAKPLDAPADATTPRPQVVVVYDAATGKEVRTLRGHDDVVWQVAFDRTGGRVITCGQDKLARVWDFTTGDELYQLAGHADWVLTAKVTPDGKTVVTGGRDNVMKIWDADSREVLADCKHPSSVTKVCLTADGSRAITACGDGRVRFWNLTTGQAKLTLVASKKPVWAMDLSRDETRLLTGGEDGELRAWPLDHPARRAGK
jgi:WD40 repeat protein